MSDQDKTTMISRPNPYVGPRAFRKGEKLYGRDRESSELLDLLIAERIMLLYSPSGAGKSSLLHAAIFPKMEEQGFAVLPIMRVNHEPPKGAANGFNRYVYSAIVSVEEAFPEQYRLAEADLLRMSFKQYIKTYRERAVHAHPDYDESHYLLIIFDQMEEVVTLNPTDRDDKMRFFIQLGDVLRDHRDIWCLAAIREDYLATLDPYLRPIPTRFSNRYRLNLLEVDAALDCVRSPAEGLGVGFDEDAARKMVNDLSLIRVQQPDGAPLEQQGLYVEPVQLQVVCRNLWNALPSGTLKVTAQDVKESGDVSTALSDYYDLQVSSVAAQSGARERAIRVWFDRELITIQGIRGQVLMGRGESKKLSNEAIWLLERGYLVRAEKRGGATWFELAHDRLITPVRESNARWFDKNLSNLQRQADLWNNQGRPDGMLFTGKDYLDADLWAKEHDDILLPAERDFLAGCREAHEAILRERRTNLIVRWLFVFAVIATIVAGVFYFQAAAAEDRAFARELAASAVNSIELDPERGVLLSLASLQESKELLFESEQALHQSLAQMRIQKVFNTHQGKIYAVAYHPNGKMVVSTGLDGTLRVWDLDTGQDTVLLQTGGGFFLTNVAFSADSGTLAASDSSGVVHVWNANTFEIVTRLKVSAAAIWGLAVSPNGRYVAAGSEDFTVGIVEVASGRLVHTFGIPYCQNPVRDTCAYGHTDVVETVAFSPDGSLLASGGDDTEIKVWDVAKGEYLYHLSGPDAHADGSKVNGLVFSPDGTRLASSGSDRTIKIWDLDTQQPITITGHVDWVYGIDFTPDGDYLISSSSDRTIRVWDTRYGREQLQLTGHTSQVYDVSVSPDGDFVASSSEDGTVRMWDISASGTRELLSMDNKDQVYSVEYSPDASLIASGGRNNVVKIWDAQTGKMLKFFTGEHRRVIEALAWDPSGKRIISAARDGKAIVWDVESGEVLQVFDNGTVSLFAVSYVPGQNLAVVGGADGVVHIWNPDNGQEVKTLDNGLVDNSISDLAFSPDGRYLAAAYFYTPYYVIVWDWQSGEVVYTLKGHTDFLQSVTFNPVNSNILASVSDDGKLIVWDLEGNSTQEFKDHIGTIYDVAFTPDGSRVITVGVDSNVKVRDLGDWTVLNLFGHTNRTLSVDVSPDGQHIVSGGADNTIRTYTLDVQELVKVANERLTRLLTDSECRTYYLTGSDYCEPSVLNVQGSGRRNQNEIMPGLSPEE